MKGQVGPGVGSGEVMEAELLQCGKAAGEQSFPVALSTV